MLYILLDIDWPSLLATLAVGVVALGSSIYFYVQTRELNKETNATLGRIKENVNKLETLYNKYIEKIMDKFIEDHDIHRDQAFKSREEEKKKSQQDNI